MATATSQYNNINNMNYNNNINTQSTNSSSSNNYRPTYNDSFDQPAEPFECDVSAILPIGHISNTSILSGTEDLRDYSLDNDSFAPSTISFQQQESSSLPQRRNLQLQQLQQQQQHQDSYSSKQESEHQDALGSRYLETETAENAWYPNQEDDHPEDYMDQQEAEEEYLYQQELAHQQSQQQQIQPQSRNLRGENNSYMSQNYNDDDPIGGHARLSTIAELSELPSLNITNNRHQSHRHDPIPSGQVIISRDLVLEDLYVEGQDEENQRDDEIRRQLLANLKPTDILGPIHETHDFKISSITGNGKQWDRLEPHQEEEQYQSESNEASLIREDGESDLSSTALALKREYEELFGSRGAIDSERSGSDVTGLMGYQDSGDLYEQDDEDDEFFGEEDDDEDVDEQEEEFYAMLDLNGGNGNMILGNNIPRKPRVLAPPPGSRLPVPGSAIKHNVPLSMQSNIVSRLPASRTTPQPTLPVTPPPPQPQSQFQSAQLESSPRSQLPTTGLRMPQVAAKKSIPAPSVPAPKAVKPTGSILDGLWQEPEYDSQPEESPGAILAAKIAKELKEEEERQKRLGALASKPSMLKPPSKLPTRNAPAASTSTATDNEMDLLTQMLKVESAPVTPLDAPTSSSSLSRATPPAGGRFSITPPKVTAQKSLTQPSLVRSTTPTANGTTLRASTLPTSRLSHKPSLSSGVAPSATSSASSSPRSVSAAATSRDSLPARTATPTRSSVLAASMARPTSMYTGALERSPSVSRTASPVNNVRMNGLRSSMYEQNNRDVSSEPLRQSSNKGPVRSKLTSKEETRSAKGMPEDLVRRSSYDRKKELQRELEEIEAEEAMEEERRAAALEDAQGRRSATPRNLLVRTSEPLRESRRSDELSPHHLRRSDERERERERERDRYSSAPSSPLSPRSPRSGYSSKRSSLYGAHGDRIVPTLEESCKQLAKIRQDIVDLREEIHQDQPGSNFGTSSLSASTARLSSSTTKQRASAKERGGESTSRRNSLESKYTRESTSANKPQHGRSDSFDSNGANNPEERVSSPLPAQNRKFFNNFLGKLNRNVLHGSSSTANLDAGLSSSQHKAMSPSKTTTTTTTTTTTYKKGQTPHSMSHPPKPSRTISETEPAHHRSSYVAGRTGTYRQQSQPLSPTQKYNGYEDRHHSGSSGQSEELSDELAYDQKHPFPTQPLHSRHSYQQQQQQEQGQSQRRHEQQHQQQQLASNQYAHYFRQADDGSLILSEKPDVAGGEHEGNCPAQIRPKELVFSSSVAGEVQSFVTLYNRSRRKMHFEILRPAGITVTPSYGVIQPGRDQRLTIHLAEMRGPGRVVVELDGEWLVPFGVSFE
ncbi:hypothetical protein BGX27_002287 [Mortierella sp. AM989]|nr:hypothetical protein BGX27_002287 [Mortierella sp. AM989]